MHPMAELRSDLKCSRTNVYAPLLNPIDALPLNVNYLSVADFINWSKQALIIFVFHDRDGLEIQIYQRGYCQWNAARRKIWTGAIAPMIPVPARVFVVSV